MKSAIIRRKIYKEDGLKSTITQKMRVMENLKPCPVCKRIIIFKTTTSPSLDHIKSISNGGRHKIKNFRIICRSCNCSKGNKD